MNNLNGFLQTSKNMSIDYKVIYDIGAQKGEFSSQLKKYYPSAKYHLFEPNIKFNKEMSECGQVHNVALWKEKDTKEFWSIGESGDSLYQEMTGVYDSVTPIHIQVESLDEYVVANNLEYPDLIKIDTQGSELDIIVGGIECIKQAHIVILECPLLPYNKGVSGMDDYIQFMQSLMFMPIYLTEVHYYNGIMMQLDIAFLNIERGTK